MKFLPILLLTLFLFIPGLRSQETPTTSRPLFVQASDELAGLGECGYWYLSLSRNAVVRNTNQGEFMSEAENAGDL